MVPGYKWSRACFTVVVFAHIFIASVGSGHFRLQHVITHHIIMLLLGRPYQLFIEEE